jgi:adenylate kinase family enzyme
MKKSPQRIAIFGRPGSGKSTFALKLAAQLKLPLIHLDKLFFTANWEPRDYEEFLTLQQTLVNQPQWIIDGNSHQSLGMRFARAELVIFFNYPRWTCLYRVFKRLFNKDPQIDDRAPGCREIVRWPLIKYLWTYDKHIYHQIRALRDAYPAVNLVEINGPQDLCALEAAPMGDGFPPSRE